MLHQRKEQKKSHVSSVKGEQSDAAYGRWRYYSCFLFFGSEEDELEHKKCPSSYTGIVEQIYQKILNKMDPVLERS